MKPLSLLGTCILLSLLAALAGGCHCEIAPPQATFLPPDPELHRHTVDAEQFDAAVLPPGDTLDLVFPCPPQLDAFPSGLKGEISDKTVTVWRSQNLTARSAVALQSPQALTLNFTSPQQYNFVVQPGIAVKPGDANNDGRINMLDLYPIAKAMYEQGGSFVLPQPSGVVSSPDTGQTYQRNATNKYWTWPGSPRAIDYVHADCNLDNVIDRRDADFLQAHLRPMKLPHMLQSAVGQIRLRAVPTGPIQVLQNSGLGYPQVRVWYDIQYASPTPDTILGIIFTRPVAEANPPGQPGAPRYAVRFIQGRTDNSALVQSPKGGLVLQQFWRDVSIQLPDSCPIEAFKAVSKPLDVGVFNLEGPQRLSSGHSCFNCGVTLDDIMGAVVNQGAPIYQHLTNVVVFSMNSAGQIEATTAECSFDATSLGEQGIEILEGPPADWYTKLQ